MTTPIAIWADVLRVWPPPLSVGTLVVVEDWAEEEDEDEDFVNEGFM